MFFWEVFFLNSSCLLLVGFGRTKFVRRATVSLQRGMLLLGRKFPFRRLVVYKLIQVKILFSRVWISMQWYRFRRGSQKKTIKDVGTKSFYQTDAFLLPNHILHWPGQFFPLVRVQSVFRTVYKNFPQSFFHCLIGCFNLRILYSSMNKISSHSLSIYHNDRSFFGTQTMSILIIISPMKTLQ